jgi:hypothetical protein
VVNNVTDKSLNSSGVLENREHVLENNALIKFTRLILRGKEI